MLTKKRSDYFMTLPPREKYEKEMNMRFEEDDYAPDEKSEAEMLPENQRSAELQADRKKDRSGGEDEGEWRLEDSIPGVPEQDYATYTSVPKTGFQCSDHQWPGYYADPEAQCQVFHICQANGAMNSFVCPGSLILNQGRPFLRPSLTAS